MGLLLDYLKEKEKLNSEDQIVPVESKSIDVKTLNLIAFILSFLSFLICASFNFLIGCVIATSFLLVSGLLVVSVNMRERKEDENNKA